MHRSFRLIKVLFNKKKLLEDVSFINKLYYFWEWTSTYLICKLVCTYTTQKQSWTQLCPMRKTLFGGRNLSYHPDVVNMRSVLTADYLIQLYNRNVGHTKCFHFLIPQLCFSNSYSWYLVSIKIFADGRKQYRTFVFWYLCFHHDWMNTTSKDF